MSAACPASSVSTTIGTPRSAGVVNSAPKRVEPDRARADRRRAGRAREPAGSRLSLTCSSPIRPGPTRVDQRGERRPQPRRARQVVPGRVQVAGVDAQPDPLVVERVEVGRDRVDVGRQRTAAAGGRLDQQPRPVGRSSSGSTFSRTWAIASVQRLPSTAEPACTTTPAAPIAAPRRSENASAARDLASVSGDGEPKLIR